MAAIFVRHARGVQRRGGRSNMHAARYSRGCVGIQAVPLAEGYYLNAGAGACYRAACIPSDFLCVEYLTHDEPKTAAGNPKTEKQDRSK
jgi:hypothetical protein